MKQVEKQLLHALARMQADVEKSKEKRDKKNWSPISLPITVKDGLNRYTKTDLDQIRRFLDIKGASSLKKAELIDLLTGTITESFQEVVKKRLVKEQLHYIQVIAQNGGYMIAPELTAEQTSYLQATGIFYTGEFEGKMVLAMPLELFNQADIHMDPGLKLEVKRNEQWIKLTRGMLYYYGYLDFDKLLEFIEKYTNEQVDSKKFFEVVHQSISYNKALKIETSGFADARVIDVKEIRKVHKMRSDISYYPFTKEQLLQAGETDFIDRNDQFKALHRFLSNNFDLDKRDAELIADECAYIARLGHGPGEALEYLQSMFEFDSMETVQLLMDNVVDLMNHTRQWWLKGYSPVSLRLKSEEESSNVIDLKSRQKVGRNHPCQCGSGKKYKKCCGK